MPTMTNEVWKAMPEEMKNRIINSIDQTIHLADERRFLRDIWRPFGDKPRLVRLASGRWIVRNTCRSWSIRFDWDIAIHWCNLENMKNGFMVIWDC